MMTEFLAQHTWLWPLAWQSTTALTLGLGASFLLRRRPVRAHQLLLWALIAAVAVPALSHWVERHQWGLFQSNPTATKIDIHPTSVTPTLSNPERAVTATAAGPTVLTEGPAATHAAAAVPIQWEQLILPLWIGLSTALLVRLVVRFLLGLHLARRSVPCDSAAIAEAVTAARARLGMAGSVSVRSSHGTRSPVIWCWDRQPLLLVPVEPDACEQVDWPSVVCHELAHWKRRDHLSGLWAELIVCLLPWNPLSWLAQRHLVRLSEEACDDWVIAAGQVGTRYARTLLGLTPQGRAALIPAVVSSKKGLATRIRRILADRCANPQAGRRWSLAAALLVGTLTAGIAFAQTRPAQPGGMITTTLDHGAVIEQLPTAVLKGIVLDPNGQPVSDPNRPAGVTVLPLTSHSTRADDDGHFEIAWSPAWLNAGQPVIVVARKYEKDLAQIVTVDDPNEPVTIQLAPALTVNGHIVGVDGHPIDKATAAVSLPIAFACRAPIASADTNDRGVFAIRNVPDNQTYTLNVRAEGYRTRQIRVTTTEARDHTIDLGSISLDPAPAGYVDRGPNPNWQEDFDKLYHLDDGQVVKLVAAPFPLARQDRLIDVTYGGGHSADMLDFAHIYPQYRWPGHLEEGWWYSVDSGHVRLSAVTQVFLDIPSYRLDLPEELGNLHLAQGDWIVRTGATVDEKMAAVKEIFYAQQHKALHIERRQVERDTIVVTGRYAFAPLPGGDPNRLCITTDQVKDLDNGEAESLPELFAWLANGIMTPIDDRTEPTEAKKIFYCYDWDLLAPPLHPRPIDKEKALPLLLDNLTKQTGLTFTVEKRPTDVWFISEETPEERG